MELDKRIIKGKRPLTCFDIEEAEKYIGKLCYMCDEYNLFYQLNLIEPTILRGVEDCEIPFHYGSDYQAEFCLPCDWATKEKRYRPYTIDEFYERFSIGQPIRYRRKGDVLVRCLILNGYADSKRDAEGTIYIGDIPYALDELFNKYEWHEHYTDDFKPFGVEE